MLGSNRAFWLDIAIHTTRFNQLNSLILSWQNLKNILLKISSIGGVGVVTCPRCLDL